MEALEEKVEALEEKVEALEEKVKTLEGKVETQVLGGIKSLEDKVEKAATNASGDWASIASNRVAIVAINNMVSKEQAHLKSKENNVIIFGLEKADTQDEVNAAVAKVFRAMKKEEVIKECKCVRLKGEKGPTIVTFKDKETQKEVLRASNKLRTATEFRNIYVNLDLTQSQMAKESELRKERALKNGELTLGTEHMKYGMHKFDGEEEV